MNKISLAILFFLLPVAIFSQKVEDSQVSAMLEQYKKDPRGPYKDIRWFCKDSLLVSKPENPVINDQPCFIYPNPGNRLFNINVSLPHFQLELFDLKGKMVFSSFMEKGTNTFSLQDIPSGLFIYRIRNDKSQIIQSGIWAKVE